MNSDDLDEMHAKHRADLKAIRNEFQHSKALLINYTFTAVLKFVVSCLFLLWIVLLSLGTLVECQGYMNCSFIDYKACSIANVRTEG